MVPARDSAGECVEVVMMFKPDDKQMVQFRSDMLHYLADIEKVPISAEDWMNAQSACLKLKIAWLNWRIANS